MTIKVAILPTFTRPDRADGGIRRVAEAQVQHLPTFDVQVVTDPAQADVLACHGTALQKLPGIPIVNHNHGLEWSRYDWPAWAHDVNQAVVDAMIPAVAHTAPSQWVAAALRRGMLVYPRVIYHGVDAETWKPSEGHDGYALWNKARTDLVSDPIDLMELAARMPGLSFVTTFGDAAPNLKITGAVPIDEMRPLVQRAGVYLALVRETFGIGTLEAMSCGVPIVGWNWGGQREIVRQGITGRLVMPGDFDGLAAAVEEALAQRAKWGRAARADVLARWGWQDKVRQYAELYHEVALAAARPRPRVTVIVTCHNLGRYLAECVGSVLAQTMADFELLILDDASDDDTPKVAAQLAKLDRRVRVHRSEENLKLPGARNLAVSLTKGRLVQFLDADDMLPPETLGVLADALDADASLHIAYGHLTMVGQDGSHPERSGWPFEAYSWWGQIAHLNQLPYNAMMKRDAFERAGGYRRRHWRAEDAPLWIAMTSLGFRAEKVTQAPTLIYRNRADSKSKGEPGDGDWTAWFPWRLAATAREGANKRASLLARQHPRPETVPFGAQGPPAAGLRFWHCHDFDTPEVSVVIPVGSGHEHLVIDAVESVRGSSFQNWEVVVVNATGKPWAAGFGSPLAGAPYAKLVELAAQASPAVARNAGVRHAKGRLIFLLDADDMLLPHALEGMIGIQRATGGLVYSDWLRSDSDPLAPMEVYQSFDFTCGATLKMMQHAVTCLIPREVHQRVGGFDETLPGWEDWVYRFRSGTVREASFGMRRQIIERLKEKWGAYYRGESQMPCSKCPNPKQSKVGSGMSLPGENHSQAAPEAHQAAVLLEYQAPLPGQERVLLRGPKTNNYYRFEKGASRYVDAADAEVFLSRSTRGQPHFVRSGPVAIAAGVEVNQPTIEAPIETVRQPSFPAMPDVAVADLTLEQVREKLVDVTPEVLVAWLSDEHGGKRRTTVIKAITTELNSRERANA